MTIETFLAVASFAISLGGLVSILLVERHKKEVVLTVVVAALVATSGVGLYRLYRHDKMIDAVERSIVAKLADNAWTFDQLYEELHYVSFPVLNEALFNAVEDGLIGHRLIQLRGADGALMQVRTYFVESQ